MKHITSSVLIGLLLPLVALAEAPPDVSRFICGNQPLAYQANGRLRNRQIAARVRRHDGLNTTSLPG